MAADRKKSERNNKREGRRAHVESGLNLPRSTSKRNENTNNATYGFRFEKSAPLTLELRALQTALKSSNNSSLSLALYIPPTRTTVASTMKCSLLLALAFRAQLGQGFVGPTGGLVLSNCVSVAARGSNNIVRRGVASTSLKAAASDKGSDVSGCYAHGSFIGQCCCPFCRTTCLCCTASVLRRLAHTVINTLGFDVVVLHEKARACTSSPRKDHARERERQRG